MKYRFLLHMLSHTTVAVNITGLSGNIAGDGVNDSSLPFMQFASWDRAKQHFLELGAEQKSLDAKEQQLKTTGAGVLTIF